MPALAFIAVVGLVLVGLLFVADATLQIGSPPIVTSERSGLPKPWHPDPVQTLGSAPAPQLDMTTNAVLAAQPSDVLNAAARASRAEAPPKIKRVTQPPIGYQRNDLFDRFSAKGQ
jgi:hypothetical protein